jgi:hypothetical protein
LLILSKIAINSAALFRSFRLAERELFCARGTIEIKSILIALIAGKINKNSKRFQLEDKQDCLRLLEDEI